MSRRKRGGKEVTKLRRWRWNRRSNEEVTKLRNWRWVRISRKGGGEEVVEVTKGKF